MNPIRTDNPEVIVLEPRVFQDARGVFFETYNERVMREIGLPTHFVQDNYSISKCNVLRGLHYQIRHAQGKLVRVTVGEVFDVAVDLRRSSPMFGKYVGVRLSAENKRALWIPPGFAHGFITLSDAEFAYKTTDYYSPADERTILWNDPDLAIQWPASGELTLSPKDQLGVPFRSAETYA